MHNHVVERQVVSVSRLPDNLVTDLHTMSYSEPAFVYRVRLDH